MRRLSRYEDELGVWHELIARHGANDSLLVIDRCSARGAEERLLAHLPADEPFENAALVCRRYLEVGPRQRRCRRVTAQDARADPDPAVLEVDCQSTEVAGGSGASYRLSRRSGRMAIPELRWTRYMELDGGLAEKPVSLREAIGEIEDYEPLCSVTRAAVLRHGSDATVSITILRAELERVLASPILLNRRLRETVLLGLARDRLSMSEIAMRCGRVKRDCKGNESGETSWLARRLGLLPEGGRDRPTPWVHSDVLGLIAREGIGVSPREVEF